jgi:hypothetical protein
MTWETIKKAKDDLRVQPNLLDYNLICAEFSWENIRWELDGLPDEKGLSCIFPPMALSKHWRYFVLCSPLLVRNRSLTL